MAMKKPVIRAAAMLSAALTASAAAVGLTFSNRIMYLKKKDDELILQREITAKRYDEVWYANVPKSEQWVQSDNGYPIKAIFLEPHETKHYAIICHGVTENKVNSFKYARMFERIGYNAVVYDHRRHGESGGKTTSFGHYEKIDLQAVVKALKMHAGEGLVFGIHGESMGASTALLYAGSVADDADFIIADCPYADMTEQLLHVMRTTTPFRSGLTLRVAGFFLRLRDGYALGTVSPRQVIGAIHKPVLFIHSKPDEFVLPKNSEELYELKEGPKAIRLFDTGAHAQSFNEHPDAYEQAVAEFLEAHGLNA